MSDFTRLVKIANSTEVQDGLNLPKAKLHKWLVLGQTEYLCEHGTLSDGHEKFTDAQKYAQALRELYYASVNIQQSEASLMLANADLLDAKEAMAAAVKESEKMRAAAQHKRATIAVLSAAATIEDQSRVLRFYHKKTQELGPRVEAQYPGGIETAEQDNWEAVLRYRMEKEKTTGRGSERVDHIPLSAERKALLGFVHGRMDATAPLMITNPARFQEMTRAVTEARGSAKNFVALAGQPGLKAVESKT